MSALHFARGRKGRDASSGRARYYHPARGVLFAVGLIILFILILIVITTIIWWIA